MRFRVWGLVVYNYRVRVWGLYIIVCRVLQG